MTAESLVHFKNKATDFVENKGSGMGRIRNKATVWDAAGG
jgi:hypothetical protein